MIIESYTEKLLIREGLKLLKSVKKDLMSPKDLIQIDTTINKIDLDTKVEVINLKMRGIV